MSDNLVNQVKREKVLIYIFNILLVFLIIELGIYVVQVSGLFFPFQGNFGSNKDNSYSDVVGFLGLLVNIFIAYTAYSGVKKYKYDVNKDVVEEKNKQINLREALKGELKRNFSSVFSRALEITPSNTAFESVLKLAQEEINAKKFYQLQELYSWYENYSSAIGIAGGVYRYALYDNRTRLALKYIQFLEKEICDKLLDDNSDELKTEYLNKIDKKKTDVKTDVKNLKKRLIQSDFFYNYFEYYDREFYFSNIEKKMSVLQGKLYKIRMSDSSIYKGDELKDLEELRWTPLSIQ